MPLAVIVDDRLEVSRPALLVLEIDVTNGNGVLQGKPVSSTVPLYMTLHARTSDHASNCVSHGCIPAQLVCTPNECIISCERPWRSHYGA